MTEQYNPDLVPWAPPLVLDTAAHPVRSDRAERIRVIRQVLTSPLNHGLSPADMARLIVDSDPLTTQVKS